MITLSMSSLGRHGRAANQFFQIASIMGLAEKHGAQAAFPDWPYEQYFETPIPHGPMQKKKVAEKDYHHYEWEFPESCDIQGYMQTEKYFGSTPLKLKESFVMSCVEKYHDLFDGKETIAIHVRRGDYVNNPNYAHLTPSWYLDALLSNFPTWRNYNILFFSDDIEYCRTNFEALPNAHFITGHSDIEDMALGSYCDHFILSNSSFSWWMAWLGEKDGSKIIHPGVLFAGRLAQENDSKDYWPKRWTEFKKDSHKIDLTDVTFTIPVFHDHDDRKKNLDLSMFMLMQSFETNFIVGEQGSSMFDYTSAWGKYVKFDSKHFHRTKMLNDMAMMAETEYVVNWDCDVIIPVAQVYMATERLRMGADVVFPYDGRFARMDRSVWFPAIQKAADIGIVGDEKFRGREIDHNSVGGAVMFNKEAFIQGGMENEYMISFGPEDCERNDRFKKLGFDVQRVKGTLFHMDHWIGPNSSTKNPFFKANHAEIDKMRLMTRDEMQAYVDGWPWRHPYTPAYYHEISEGSIRSAKIVMGILLGGTLKPTSVIDIGGGVGEWNWNNPDYYCVDHGIDKKQLLIPEDHYIDIDLNKEMPKKEDFNKFDMCICLEVAEHLKESRATDLVKSLCDLSDIVLFSAAIPGQGGTGHVNEAWQTYWASIFTRYGFGPRSTQPDIRNNPDVELWYRQNIVLYEKNGKGKVVDFVLPEYYIEIVKGLKARK